MNDVKGYYDKRVARSDNLKWQVGKTVDGRSVDDEQLDIIVDTIKWSLRLSHEDQVVDIGCGNGVVSQKVAKYTNRLVGIENSDSLRQTAELRSNADNIEYISADMFSFDFASVCCNKMYMYEVVQHLEYSRIPTLLALMKNALPRGAKVFVGGIPDEARKWRFYNTKQRRFALIQALVESSDPIGTWFHREYWQWLGTEHGFKVKVMDQKASLYTSHYRFDCLLEVGS